MGNARQSGMKRRIINWSPTLVCNLTKEAAVGILVALAAGISVTPVLLNEVGILGRRVGGWWLGLAHTRTPSRMLVKPIQRN